MATTIQSVLFVIAALICIVMGFAMTIGLYPMPGEWTDAIFYCCAVALIGLAIINNRINDY